jgi:hypothetical protein
VEAHVIPDTPLSLLSSGKRFARGWMPVLAKCFPGILVHFSTKAKARSSLATPDADKLLAFAVVVGRFEIIFRTAATGVLNHPEHAKVL